MCRNLPQPLDAGVAQRSVRIQAAGNGGHVRLWTERNSMHVQIHVADSGSGPPESLRSAMFEPFVTSKPEGIGLGLALAKAAAEEHGGSLSFARVDEHTRFTMSLAVGSQKQMGLSPDEDFTAAPTNVLPEIAMRVGAENRGSNNSVRD